MTLTAAESASDTAGGAPPGSDPGGQGRSTPALRSLIDGLERIRQSTERARQVAAGPGTGPQLGRYAGLILGFVAVIELAFRTSPADFVSGVSLGALYGIIAVGIILIYRTARVINFAAGAIGAVPAIFALLLDVQDHVSYLVCLPIAVVGGPLFGLATDVFLMRRFAKTARLLATVATIGVAETLAVAGFPLPLLFGQKNAEEVSLVPTPWQTWVIHNGRGQPMLTGNEVAAIVVVSLMGAGIAVFLRYTRMGIALRASSENADRAALLGIPVKRVSAVAWALAGLLSAVAIFFQSPLIGVPSNASLGFDTLLYALAAALVARMERIGLALGAGMAIGVVIFSTIGTTGDSSESEAIMLLLIIGALLFQRKGLSRAQDSGEGTWQSVRMYRPVPRELTALKEVVASRYVLGGIFAAVMVVLPFVVGDANVPYLILMPLYGIVAVSLVVLTGWAGQISLGQFGLVGIAAEISGGLIANHNIDFFAALGLGIGVGAVAALLVGLPAVRIPGLFLAATTLAFGYAIEYYVMNTHYWIGRHLMPSGLSAHLERPILYGRIDLSSDKSFYFVCLIAMVAVMLAAQSFRRLRSGRVLIAVRDNPRAAPAYSINLTRTRLAAFAVSGAICGVAGVLFAYAQRNVVPGSYDVLYGSINVFLAVVIGGVSSVPFAVIGAMSLEAAVAFGPRLYDLMGATMSQILPLLLTGPLLLISMYYNPGGSADSAYNLRDRYLRRLADRNRILVPSLVADRRVEQDMSSEIIGQAEAHLETVEVSE
ncbi:MAG TPA: ABC transporter permease [Acidimicrobiales bacterium]|nr:ABC transporter permease [Acidimicrobiales bacterium]